MMNKKEKYQEFCFDLTKKYLDELSGEGKNNEYILNNRPSEKVLIGILDSGIQNSEDTRYTSMPMMKVQFFVNSESKGNFEINISGNLYYNVLPTYDEQMTYVNAMENEIKKRKINEEDEEKIFENDKLVSKFKRVSVNEALKNIEIDIQELIKNGEVDFSDEINKKLYCNLDFSDAVFYNDKTISSKEALESEEKYNKYIEEHTGGMDDQIFKGKLNWEFSGYVSCKKTNEKNKYAITVVVENSTEKLKDYNAKMFEEKKYSIPMYNVGMNIKAKNGLKFENIELENFKNSYKTNSNVKVKGEWLSAECIDDVIITKNIPTYIENRLITTEKYNLNTNIKNLQKDPIGNLNAILKGMKEYLNEISSRNIDSAEFKSDVKKFANEIIRFERGIKILQDSEFENVKKAFECMNKTFEKNIEQWRLFQIVFIVSMISDIIYNDNKDYLESEIYNYTDSDIAEIIFFPTGGGKTEAFLGTVVLSMFYDRFSGKKYGVNTMIRYPLRLLSIQQLERTFSVIFQANEIMKSVDEISNMPEFSLGYLVGSSNTPNEVNEKNLTKCEHNKDYILVDKCPVCKGNVDIVYNEKNRVLEHKCKECNYVLPLYIVDDDIYRFLPTVIIGTIDKLATMSLNDGFRNIFGASKYRCKIHGFNHDKHCICNKSENIENVYETQESSLAPTLFIQDEVHLLKESLGVFSSHYESFVNYYISSLLEEKYRKKIKYIGATATISGAESLVDELYGKECRIFPSPSTYENGNNFYAEKSDKEISRIIMGFAPFGDSINARIEYAVSTLREILNYMYENPKELCAKYEMNEEEIREMIYYYWTSIVYCGSKNDNNKLRNTFEQQANSGRFLNDENIKFNIVRMTGDESFSQIKQSLVEMSNERNKKVADNLVLATSTISHGVDSKDFNNIFFYGVPSNTAEYIQSYSRVGRTFTGFVVDIIRLARNRDISFLKYFNMMHQYKDYLIDENRISSKSIMAMYHTFPGIILGLFRHYYSLRDNKKYETLKEINDFFWNDTEVKKENYIDIYEKLCIIYKCQNVVDNSSVDAEFKEKIQIELNKLIANIRKGIGEQYTNNQKVSSLIGELTGDGFKVMSSLRDVDPSYDINIIYGGDANAEE